MKTSRLLRRRLILTTILTVTPFMSYGREAYAACVANPAPPSFLCSGSNTTTQTIGVDNANVATAPGFSVGAAAGDGIEITGDGALKFTDANLSAIEGAVYGLQVNAVGNSGGTPGSVTIEANGDIAGGVGGISVMNLGTGFISITVDGTVSGAGGDGILAHDIFGAGDLMVTTGIGSTVTGATNGIEAINGVGGDIVITAMGVVAGGMNGIKAVNVAGSVELTIATEAGSLVTARDNDGINADNYGNGNLVIAARGVVTGGADGIDATNRSDGKDLVITADAGSVVTGGDDGIEARQIGAGNLLITVNGEVTGRDKGIGVDNDGDGATSIMIGTGGLVQGRFTGIFLDSDAGQDVLITNHGVLRNLSGAAEDIAILAAQEVPGVTDIGDVTITNSGSLIGRVGLGSGNDKLTNSGLWDTRGNNEFGDGTDEIVNTGILVAAGNREALESTVFGGVEYLRNSGLITLVDSDSNDELILSSDYVSEDGTLAVDAKLARGPFGQADKLIIDGNVDGVTKVSVNVVDAIGANTDGIMVAASEGTTQAGHFVLKDGPISAGFFTWDMRYDAINHWHELYTSGIGVGAYELAAGITGAQDIWHQTTGTLAQRQADLRPLLNGPRVMPVADFAQPVEPSPLGRVGPGFWMTGLGAWLERDAEQDGFTLDRKQAIYGGLAGFDFALEEAGNAWLFGIFAGYVGSTLKFSETNTKWTYDGPSVGAYATYLNDAFYADLTIKADFLSISIDPDDLAPQADDSDTDAVNLGARIDTGYKFGGAQGVFVEPQATLAVVNTDIDDADIYGGTADFDDETSVKGRLGLRLGYDHTATNAVVYSSDLTASVWHEFNGSNDVSITTTDFPTFGVADDTVETLGDISLGFGVVSPEGWSGFVRGNYQFAEDYDAITGNAGVRYTW